MMVRPVNESIEHKTIMIDATCLEAHRTACGLREKKNGAGARSEAV